jgi:molecular chaperone DnaK
VSVDRNPRDPGRRDLRERADRLRDRGRLSASALVPALDQAFDHVAHLLVPDADPEVLESTVADMRRRIDSMRSEAFRQGSTRVIERLAGASNGLSEITAGIEAARGGDEDAGQKARRSLIELDATLADVELEGKWPELETKARDEMMFATEWVGRYGSKAENQLLDEVAQAVSRARDARNIGELQRQLRLARRLGTAAFYRHPEAWEWMFESAASEVHSATNLPEAQRLVRQGRDAIARNDTPTLRRTTEGLWRLLPSDAKHKRLSFDSGLR